MSIAASNAAPLDIADHQQPPRDPAVIAECRCHASRRVDAALEDLDAKENSARRSTSRTVAGLAPPPAVHDRIPKRVPSLGVSHLAAEQIEQSSRGNWSAPIPMR